MIDLILQSTDHEHDSWWHCILDWIDKAGPWQLGFVLLLVWILRDRLPFVNRFHGAVQTKPKPKSKPKKKGGKK